MRLAKEPGYFEDLLAHQEEGRKILLLAEMGGNLAGFCILNWNPRYGLFNKLGIPETQDLNVLPSCRRQGVATALIAYCEELSHERGCTQIGISFGLHSGFGAAQRLYFKLGYMPDGNGITYDRKTVQAGEIRPVDDHLCLMLVKNLMRL
jgi:GNAT superfamily N-acetyltransferase